MQSMRELFLCKHYRSRVGSVQSSWPQLVFEYRLTTFDRLTKRPHMNTPTPIAIKAHEAAKLLGISRRTVQLLAKRGEIPHRRIGKLYLFSPIALQEWMNANAGEAKIDSAAPEA